MLQFFSLYYIHFFFSFLFDGEIKLPRC